MALQTPCPENSFRFNSTLCACNPGYLLNFSAKNCTLFEASVDDWSISSGVEYSASFPETIFAFDSIKKFTQSQAVFLEATLVLVLSWLLFCFFVRFRKLGDGSSIWFRIRWWISRLDFCFATRHWLDDRKVVMKRKTELGGAFSIASWILFVGLFAALLYQIISKRSVEVHNLRAANAPDLLSFINDMEFNITTISSMSCSHLRGLGTLVAGTPGFIDYRTFPLTNFVNYSCHNTSLGPTITLKCSNCHIVRDDLYVSWQFVDLPNDPATAVGFNFNFTAKNHNNKHVSFVNGVLKNGSNMDGRPITFRGRDVNILKFHLLPRIYRNHHGLKLIQPLFHEFVPGSTFLERRQLQDSLQSVGLINTTLFINFLSAYIVEIDDENFMGPVSFFADLGGLYAISFAIFFYLLVQCEYRVKKLRNEDSVLRNIRNRKKAQQHWDKLRKYVMYTWGCSSMLDDINISSGDDAICGCVTVEPFRGNGSLHKRKPSNRMDSISLNERVNLPIEMNAVRKTANTERVKSFSAGTPANLEHGSSERDGSQPQVSLVNDSTLPLPPDLEFKTDSGTDISDIRKNLQNLYEYNVMLREKFIAAQSMIEALTKKDSVSNSTSNT
ncbi:hypothetical protein BVC80_605g6 [Macleaya cordata]|uniref:Transmembrane protein n=1 Tax=Macleaya cordata TaxID=56857 RepID=A0A200R0F2_MACCD|nr:hypothetical protein BVC80_605g6 [Macleaya cordata]